MIETLRLVALDLLVVIGGAIALAVLLRFGAATLDVIPMNRARRAMVARLRPLVGAALIATYLAIAARWVLDTGDWRAPFAVAVVAAIATAASWPALRDLLEGVYVRAAGTLAAGDRVQLDGVRGRVQRLGHRAVVVETPDGDLALVPYRRLAGATVRRAVADGPASFHVFRARPPDAWTMPELKRAVREAALLCHWSSIARPPEVAALDGGEVEITVFPVDADHAPDLERAVRRALAG